MLAKRVTNACVLRQFLLSFSVAMATMPAAAAEPPGKPINFYGKRVTLLKLFGQARWGDCSPGRVDGTKIYHAAGVVVDRSRTPEAVYVADTGNNRILGFRSMESPKADLIFGQPDEFSGAPNGDCNIGRFAAPTRQSMCLIDIPGNTNLAEQWMRVNIDVDGEGNLYVPDFGNNRVLVYRSPFSDVKAGGKGDNLPDLVIGQLNYTSNGPNRGMGPQRRDAGSLFLSYGGFDHVASRGVSVDRSGNVWVADTFNHRVLRFPKGKIAADLVLGQPSFNVSEPIPDINQARPDRTCTPTVARLHPETGELWVVDEYPGGFPARILVFKPPLRSGMAADRVVVPKQLREGDYRDGYRFTHCTGLVFNPVKTDDWIDEKTRTHRYRDGVVWVHDQTRTMLLDGDGNILLVVGATDSISSGWSDRLYSASGVNYTESFHVRSPGGMMGFDSENRIYLADEAFHRIARYALPWRPGAGDQGATLPKPDGGLFPGTRPNTVGPAHFHADRVGVLAYKNQLIVRDEQRYLVWNDYLAKADGTPADHFVGQSDGTSLSNRNHIMGRATHAVDHHDRLWATGEHGRLMVYQLPLTAGASPLRELVPFFWSDDPDTEVDYRCGQPLTFEPESKSLWVVDGHRLLRVRLPDDVDGKLLVDAVVGQKNKTDRALNRGMGRPDAASFGDVNDVKFDRRGNLFVVDNTYELHHNGRILAFLAEDLKKIDVMFPDIHAKRVYVASKFDEPVHERVLPPGQSPHSPVAVAFNSRNEMVVGNDGYFDTSGGRPRHVNQLYLYRRPFEKTTPDAVIELPLGAAGELAFDDADNLIVQDHTYNKVWVINFDRDPVWLRPLR